MGDKCGPEAIHCIQFVESRWLEAEIDGQLKALK